MFWLKVNSVKFFSALLKKVFFLFIILVKKIFGDLLFNFSVIGIMFCVVYCIICWFIFVELVNVILVMCFEVVRYLLIILFVLLIMFIMFGGSKLLIIFISSSIESGVRCVGFSII